MVFLPLLLLVALGTTTLLDTRIRLIVVAIAVVAGLIGSVQNIDTQRTQAPQVAAVINSMAKPGDIIAFCPDQIGPSVYRLIDDPAQYTMLTFPRGTSPSSSTGSTTPRWCTRPRRTSSHPRWWPMPAPPTTSGWSGSRVTETYGVKCQVMAATLLSPQLTAGGHTWVTNKPSKYYEPMNLTEYAPRTS